jgi:hypothetical protein
MLVFRAATISPLLMIFRLRQLRRQSAAFSALTSQQQDRQLDSRLNVGLHQRSTYNKEDA